ncbi:ADP-ribosylation factor-binding protein GGA1 [Protopterus annectens]|uniref:ADP-ribosylation factor-binding protein GGA1 n=1 Tax=Protopterus annectens TaxID=7888 RepID=UPI001CFBFA4A|nr:ADP-ribosylation factor-binding protein GGA1 [Protopterus annectens]
MAAPLEEDSLESKINNATNPLNKELQWDSINSFCEQLNKELEGPQHGTRLLAHKIQSPQEWEAIQALTVLETCMKNCGKRFHNEVGKFRFLNEMIKIVSPKYLGTRSSEKVKLKVIELMYSWTVGLPDELKISEAYQMLKKQGIVKEDPILLDDRPFIVPTPRPMNAVFEDEEKSKMLARLLKSTHPEDLRAANKLIKEMVQEDQKRTEKITKRVNAIEEVNNNVKLLTEMLSSYSKETSLESNDEIMKELFNRCEKMRPTLFRLASDTEDNDEALAEILQANDNLTQVINAYKQIVRGEEVNGDTGKPPIKGSSSALLDLSGLEVQSAGTYYPSYPAVSAAHLDFDVNQGSTVSLLDDELMSLGLNDPAPNSVSAAKTLEATGWNSFQSSESGDLNVPSGTTASSAVLSSELVTAAARAPSPSLAPPSSSTLPGSKALDDLDLLGKTMLEQSLPPGSPQVKWEKQQPKPTLRDLQNKTSGSTNTVGTTAIPPATTRSISPSLPVTAVSNNSSSMAFHGVSSVVQTVFPSSKPDVAASHLLQQELSLANVLVPLTAIKPSSILPVTVYDKNSFRVLFHFAKDCPAGRPDVLVVVTSMISTAPLPVKNIVFQSAVPKSMKVKLQPPSGTELPAFNPIVPPMAITQVLLLANPQKEKVRLRYKLTFTMGDKTYNEVGDVDQFPHLSLGKPVRQ